MRIVAPYVTFAPGVVEALAATDWRWERADVSADVTAYWALLADLWLAGEPFCIVEHDVLVRPGTFDELADCPHRWCAFPVPYLGGEYAGLGCVKFSAELIAACPDALQRVGHMSNAGHEPRHYCTVDAWLQVVLMSTSIPRHVHQPALGHWRPYPGSPWPSHGCHGSPPRGD